MERIVEQENKLSHVEAEINKLREDLHHLYISSNHVTSDVLNLSCALDEKINEYLRIKGEN